ncbi:hypothetical protein [Massilia sp.]|uniref:NACHT domain-containing protein n=1 Tax=Massilia sp. TaxID=1882437 RepID=UPI0028966A37|nr:hypothetical protein [Massilia sp.]
MDTLELSKLNPQAFENLVNLLALKTLGSGVSGFGPGADGGRDGYFEGSAPYPSTSERWDGVWYLQSKFYSGISNGQKWLIEQVKKEIALFDNENSDRIWPRNWIIASNIDPSGKPETGSFDAIRQLLKNSSGGKDTRLAIWGGRKILDLLALNHEISSYYRQFLTPGHVLTSLYDQLEELKEERPTLSEILRYFVVHNFAEQTYTKLEQAGSSSDTRPAVHDLFIDLPYIEIFSDNRNNANDSEKENLFLALTHAAHQSHRHSFRKTIPELEKPWGKNPKRARVTMIKGGPGQGKSTIGQYLSQIHRAALILAADGPNVTPHIYSTAIAVREAAERDGYWPNSARIPIQLELKEYAHWHSQRESKQSAGVLSYICEIAGKKLGIKISEKTLKNSLSKQAWLIIFDGLDEVPTDHKDRISSEVISFTNDLLIEIDSDSMILCSSRPQGYSGQFADLDGAEVMLAYLSTPTALRCATPLLKFNRAIEEGERFVEILESALKSPNIQELMTTPLQSHIMAVVVRDGGKPPERRWRLFQSFYQVMKRREAMKDYKNKKVAELLRGEDRLLKSVHMRLGFVLHARAERSSGAQAVLTKAEFEELVKFVVEDLGAENISDTVSVVMEATTERLVLVSTPDNGDKVRFDIRQLQEFFAAEYLYDGVSSRELAERIQHIGCDAHWREVMHFLLSAFIADRRTSEFAVAVQELVILNERNFGDIDAIYWKKNAPTSIMALRLLLEGVLEDDQKDRRHLKPLVSAIGGIGDVDRIRSFGKINQRNSKIWLINVLMERIATANAVEATGAFFLLGLIPNLTEVDEVILYEKFINLPGDIIDYLVESWVRNARAAYRVRTDKLMGNNVDMWILKSFIKILNSPLTLDLKPTTVRSMITVLRDMDDIFVDAAQKTGIEVAKAQMIYNLAIRAELDASRQEDSQTEECGIFGINRAQYSWVNAKVPEALQGLSEEDAFEGFEGMFEVIASCGRFSISRSNRNLEKFSSIALAHGERKLISLPNSLLALVPTGGTESIPRHSISHLSHYKFNEDIENYLSKLKDEIGEPSWDYHLRDMEIATREDWEKISENQPDFAMQIIFEPDFTPIRIEKTVMVPQLEKLILANPSTLTRYALQWGKLSNISPLVFKKFLEEVKKTPHEVLLRNISSNYDFDYFSLSLPADNYLIPILAAAVAMEVGPRWDYSPADSMKEIFSGYGLDADALREIMLDKNLDKIIRSGAAFFYWAIICDVETSEPIFSNNQLTNEFTLYKELTDQVSEKWLARVFLGKVLIGYHEQNISAMEIFVDFISNDFKGEIRADINNVMNVWRERSSAPLTSQGLLPKWLGYTSTIPSYAV